MAVHARGYNDLIKDMYVDPKLAHKLIRKVSAQGEPFMISRDFPGQKLSRVRVVDLYDSFLGHLLPFLLRELVLPYY